MIWRASAVQQHWRSILASTFQIATPNTNTSGNVFVDLPMMASATTAGFWESGGGIVASDTGGSIPTFNGDLTVRGGTIGCFVQNPNTEVSVGYKLWVVRTINVPQALVNPDGTTQAVGWDPSLHPDFAEQFGSVVAVKEGSLEPVASMTYLFRLPVHRVDPENYRTALGGSVTGGGQYAFVVMIWRIGQQATPAAVTCTQTFWHNMSFTGDINGTVA